MSKSPSSFRAGRPLLLAALAVCAAAVLPAARVRAAPQGDEAALALELRYVDALNADGLADLAELVLKDVGAKYPGAQARLKVKNLEQFLQLGKFDEAQ